MLMQDRLKQLLSFNPETGDFVRLTRAATRIHIGDVVKGCNNGEGYLRIRIDRRAYMAHRLAWLYMTGEWPKAQIDHINMDRADNRFCNLREATNAQNKANSRAHRSNLSGAKGITSVRRKFRAQVEVAGIPIYLGYFNTRDEAHAAYMIAAAKKYCGEFARGA